MPTITTPDNGYFEVWERPCGHTVRVNTEFTQWARRHGERRSLQAQDRARLASKPCRQCTEAAAQ